MLATQRQKLDQFNRVLEFVDGNPPPLANAPLGYTAQVQALRDAVATITGFSQDRGSGTPRYTTAQRRAFRASLRLQLSRGRRIARILERSVVGMPHLINITRKSASEQSLLDTARAAVRDVTPFKDEFVAKGMPDNFLDTITTSIGTIEAARDDATAAARRLASAKGGLQDAISVANDAVVCLNEIVRHACSEDSVNGQSTLTAWNAIVPPRGKSELRAAVAGGVPQVASQGVVSQSAVSQSAVSQSAVSQSAGAQDAPSTAASGGSSASSASTTTPLPAATAEGGSPGNS